MTSAQQRGYREGGMSNRCRYLGYALSMHSTILRCSSSLITVQVARAIGCTVSYWEVQESQDGSLAFNVADLLSMLTLQTKLVVVNFPHNPTGPGEGAHRQKARL